MPNCLTITRERDAKVPVRSANCNWLNIRFWWRWYPKSIVNDFGNMLGVVSGRAAAILRSTETYPTLADLWYAFKSVFNGLKQYLRIGILNKFSSILPLIGSLRQNDHLKVLKEFWIERNSTATALLLALKHYFWSFVWGELKCECDYDLWLMWLGEYNCDLILEILMNDSEAPQNPHSNCLIRLSFRNLECVTVRRNSSYFIDINSFSWLNGRKITRESVNVVCLLLNNPLGFLKSSVLTS